MTEVATMCDDHLREEERLLTAALPMVRAIQRQFTHRSPDHVAELAEQHQTLTRLIRDMQKRRQALREAIARRLHVPADEVRLSRIVDALPPAAKAGPAAALQRVRALAHELATTNHRLSLHLRIYLDAYQRLLRDLTGTGSGSGRYGPYGKADRPEYRPLLQIHG